MPHMYILECDNGKYYTGSTKNLILRMIQHWTGEGANYTRKHRPIRLVYAEEFLRVDKAFYREKQVQNWSHEKKKALVESNYEALHNLAECRNESRSSLGYARDAEVEFSAARDAEVESSTDRDTGVELSSDCDTGVKFGSNPGTEVRHNEDRGNGVDHGTVMDMRISWNLGKDFDFAKGKNAGKTQKSEMVKKGTPMSNAEIENITAEVLMYVKNIIKSPLVPATFDEPRNR